MPDLAFVEDDPGSPAIWAASAAEGANGGALPAPGSAGLRGRDASVPVASARAGPCPGTETVAAAPRSPEWDPVRGGPAPGGGAALTLPYPAPGGSGEEPPPAAPPTPSDDMDLEERGSPGGAGSGEDAALPDMDLGSPERPADGPGAGTPPLHRPPADPGSSQGRRAACSRVTSKQISASIVPRLGNKTDSLRQYHERARQCSYLSQRRPTACLRVPRAAPACAGLAPRRRVVDYGARRASRPGVHAEPVEAGPPPPPPGDPEALPNGRGAHRAAAAAPQVRTRLGAGRMAACAGLSGAALMSRHALHLSRAWPVSPPSGLPSRGLPALALRRPLQRGIGET